MATNYDREVKELLPASVGTLEEMGESVKAQDEVQVFTLQVSNVRKIIPRYITIEGLDGSGKSMLIGALVDLLEAEGIDVIVVNQVSGKIKEAILSDPSLSPTQRMMLYYIASQTAAEKIRKALSEGKMVLSDRGFDSFIAYQGFGEGLQDEISKLAKLDLFPAFPTPDLTIYLAMTVEESLNRINARRGKEGLDVMESMDIDFMLRVKEGFEALIASDEDRFFTIRATLRPGAVASAAFDRITWFFE